MWGFTINVVPLWTCLKVRQQAALHPARGQVERRWSSWQMAKQYWLVPADFKGKSTVSDRRKTCCTDTFKWFGQVSLWLNAFLSDFQTVLPNVVIGFRVQKFLSACTIWLPNLNRIKLCCRTCKSYKFANWAEYVSWLLAIIIFSCHASLCASTCVTGVCLDGLLLYFFAVFVPVPFPQQRILHLWMIGNVPYSLGRPWRLSWVCSVPLNFTSYVCRYLCRFHCSCYLWAVWNPGLKRRKAVFKRALYCPCLKFMLCSKCEVTLWFEAACTVMCLSNILSDCCWLGIITFCLCFDSSCTGCWSLKFFCPNKSPWPG